MSAASKRTQVNRMLDAGADWPPKKVETVDRATSPLVPEPIGGLWETLPRREPSPRPQRLLNAMFAAAERESEEQEALEIIGHRMGDSTGFEGFKSSMSSSDLNFSLGSAASRHEASGRLPSAGLLGVSVHQESRRPGFESSFRPRTGSPRRSESPGAQLHAMVPQPLPSFQELMLGSTPATPLKSALSSKEGRSSTASSGQRVTIMVPEERQAVKAKAFSAGLQGSLNSSGVLITGRTSPAPMSLKTTDLPPVIGIREELPPNPLWAGLQETRPSGSPTRLLLSRQSREEDSRATTASSVRIFGSRQGGRSLEEVALDRRGLAQLRIGDPSDWPAESGGIYFISKSTSAPDLRKTKPPVREEAPPIVHHGLVQLPVVGIKSRPPVAHSAPIASVPALAQLLQGGPAPGSGSPHAPPHGVTVGGGAKMTSPRTLAGADWPPSDESWEYGLGPPLPLLDRFASSTQERMRWTKEHMQVELFGPAAASPAPPASPSPPPPAVQTKVVRLQQRL